MKKLMFSYNNQASISTIQYKEWYKCSYELLKNSCNLRIFTVSQFLCLNRPTAQSVLIFKNIGYVQNLLYAVAFSVVQKIVNVNGDWGSRDMVNLTGCVKPRTLKAQI